MTSLARLALKWFPSIKERAVEQVFSDKKDTERIITLYPAITHEAFKIALDKPADLKNNWRVGYIDSEGAKYYTPKHPKHLPTDRARACEKFMEEARAGLSKEELAQYFSSVLTEADNIKGSVTNSTSKEDMAKRIFNPLANLEKHVKLAKWHMEQVPLNPDSLLRLAAAQLVHEDEDPLVYDEAWQEKKIEIFEADKKKESGSGFWTTPTMSHYLLGYSGSTADFERYWQSLKEMQSQVKIEIANMSD